VAHSHAWIHGNSAGIFVDRESICIVWKPLFGLEAYEYQTMSTSDLIIHLTIQFPLNYLSNTLPRRSDTRWGIHGRRR